MMKYDSGQKHKGPIGRVVLGLISLGLVGCVQIETPDKPIVINLNINIRQEIVHRLDGDAKQLIDKESGIF